MWSLHFLYGYCLLHSIYMFLLFLGSQLPSLFLLMWFSPCVCVGLGVGVVGAPVSSYPAMVWTKCFVSSVSVVIWAGCSVAPHSVLFWAWCPTIFSSVMVWAGCYFSSFFLFWWSCGAGVSWGVVRFSVSALFVIVVGCSGAGVGVGSFSGCIFGGWLSLRAATVSVSPGMAPVPLSIFRSNSKFDENSERSSFEYTRLITTIFCTRHDNDTVVTCARYLCDRPCIFYTRLFWIFIIGLGVIWISLWGCAWGLVASSFWGFLLRFRHYLGLVWFWIFLLVSFVVSCCPWGGGGGGGGEGLLVGLFPLPCCGCDCGGRVMVKMSVGLRSWR